MARFMQLYNPYERCTRVDGPIQGHTDSVGRWGLVAAIRLGDRVWAAGSRLRWAYVIVSPVGG
jgi:hypothetical protein